MSFTDHGLGNRRFSRGVDIRYVFARRPEQGGSEPYRTSRILIRLGPAFTSLTDIISVYEDNESSNPVYVLTGTEALQSNTSVYAIDVLSSNPSIIFRSKNTAGFHFNATASFSPVCPTGYYADNEKCRVNDYTTRNVVIIGGVILALSALITYMAVKKKNIPMKVIRTILKDYARTVFAGMSELIDIYTDWVAYINVSSSLNAGIIPYKIPYTVFIATSSVASAFTLAMYAYSLTFIFIRLYRPLEHELTKDILCAKEKMTSYTRSINRGYAAIALLIFEEIPMMYLNFTIVTRVQYTEELLISLSWSCINAGRKIQTIGVLPTYFLMRRALQKKCKASISTHTIPPVDTPELDVSCKNEASRG
jgi:hypothetical protein